MFYRRILLLLLLTITFTKAFPAVFVVTSNADSGTGTLRDALTKANNAPGKNYISFNLPGTKVSDRTITLLSYLPVIINSTVIDGTTQPGKSFGISDTKIRVANKFTYPAGTVKGVFQVHNCRDFEMYGIWITSEINLGYQASLITSHCDSVQFGAASKGNLIESSGPTIDTGKVCYFQHNICFSDTTGERPGDGLMIINGYDKVVIGGSLTTGNMIAAGLDINFTNPLGSELEISYNKMGTNFYGTAAPYGFSIMEARVYIAGGNIVNERLQDVPLNALIKNNIIADVYQNNLLLVESFTNKSKIIIQGNGFNTDLNGNYNFNTYSQGGTSAAIVSVGPQTAIIGGDDPSEKNIMAYCLEGVQYDLGDGTGKVLISRNSIFCYGDAAVYPQQSDPPSVAISAIDNGKVIGTSTPNSIIELFKASCSCSIPGPKDYLTTVKSDNKGNWSYSGIVNGYIMASATLDSLTGIFAGLQIDAKKVVTENATCGSNGSVKGILSQFKNQKITWYNSNNQIILTGSDLVNVPPGTYTLKIDFGENCGITATYNILDYNAEYDATNVKIINPSCAKDNGSITGLGATYNGPGSLDISWKDQSGKVWSKDLNLLNVPAGNYLFTISTDNCSKTYGPITLKNTSGPNIDQVNAKIQPTNCGEATGSITDISVTGTGTLKYSWKNDQQQEVGTTKDLTGQPAGIYTLEVTDDTQCGPVYGAPIMIPETNGITLDESKVQTTVASCSMDNGTITGMQVTGDAQYKWVDADNKIAGTGLDLKNAAPGDYVFIAYNNFGCSAASKTYHIFSQPPTQFPPYNSGEISACAGQTNGSLYIQPDALVKSIRWVNSEGTTVGTQATLSNAGAGVYQLYLTDKNGCESFIGNYTIIELPVFSRTNTEITTNDQCGLKTGSITGSIVSGGLPPYTYQWFNSDGVQLGSGSTLQNLGAGTYTLNVADAICGKLTINYNIFDVSEAVATPTVSDVQLCSAGDALLKVNNASSNTIYRLYNDASSPQPLQELKGGTFKITAASSRSYFVSQLNGECESTRTEVKVSVGLSGINIANTFTPNGDGFNDYWTIPGIENYPNALIQVFSRYGQKVFESRGYNHPFDGTRNGQNLLVGTYYYIINLSTNCSVLSGSLTIIR